MKKQELYNLFKKHFKEQMNLNLEEVLTIQNDKFILSMELMAISMASMKLELSKEEHGQMADFLSLIQEDNNPLAKFKTQ
tara:strand:+ start:41359 stop:41598 length:240 start_codon:yes stop_codon:yes gene_type:complete